MKGIGTVGLAVAAVVLAGAALLITTPALEGTDARNRDRADEGVEKARRLLALHSAYLDLARSVSTNRAELVEVDSESLRELVEQNTRDVEQVAQVLGDLTRAHDQQRAQVPDESRQFMQGWGFPDALIDEAFYVSAQTGRREQEWRRAAGDVGPAGGPMMRGLGGGPDDQARSLAEAHARTQREQEANAAVLKSAASTLQEALGLVPDHVAANQMLAAVNYQLALIRHFDAMRLRSLAERLRPGIIKQSARIRALESQNESIEQARQIEAAIDQASEAIREFQTRIGEQERVVSDLQNRLEEKERLLAETEAAAAAARQAYEQLLAAGYDATDPAAYVTFVESIGTLGRSMIEAERQTDAQRHGTVHGVHEEPPGDYLRGRYVPDAGDAQVEFVESVSSIEWELATEQSRLEKLVLVLKDMNARLEQLEETQRTLQQAFADAAGDLNAMRKTLDELVQEAAERVVAARQIETEARRELLETAYRCARAAQQGQSSRISRAGQRKSEASPGAETPIQDSVQQERSWMSAALSALEGQIALLDATMFARQAHDLLSHRRALGQAGQAGAAGIDLRAVSDELENARRAALDAAHAAAEHFNQAVRIDPQWVYQANLGIALRLLSQIDPSNESFRQAAIAAIRGCIQGREEQPTAMRLAALLAALEGSEADSGTDDASESDAADPAS